MANYFLGLISGTSVDGVDAALCAFGERECRLEAARTFAYPSAIAARIQSLIAEGEGALAEIGALDTAVGRYFADCALALLEGARIAREDVRAIGHHGQTIWHRPDPPEPFSWQLGDPNSIAAITGIDTVADLRRLDMALGGQGAPLVPAFHEWLFADTRETRIVLNIGGIANLTLLAPGRDLLGFDTGPGNTLLDLWVGRCLDQPFDEGGHWAAGGRVDRALLEALRDDDYFSSPIPKSTGRERFNETWLQRKLAAIGRPLADQDVAASLLELTAGTIVDAIESLDPAAYSLIVCGGGAKNSALMQRLGELTRQPVTTTEDYGIDTGFVEAAAMAWLARARVESQPGNRPSVTAARATAVLGALYSGAGTS